MRLVPVLAWALIAGAAYSNETCNVVTCPLTSSGWTLPISVPRFDPQLGVLNSVSLRLTATLQSTLHLETLEEVPGTYDTEFNGPVDILGPDLAYLVGARARETLVLELSAFDGTLDYAGTSGITHSGGLGLGSGLTTLTDPAVLASFTGAMGSPGTITLLAIGSSSSFTTFGVGPSGYALYNIVEDASISTSATLRVCYSFTPFSAPFCLGDPTTTNCPCGNNPPYLEGCLNSTGAGALLLASGQALASNDTLTLSCTQLPTSTPALLFQGNHTAGETLTSGPGIVFGDGLRCISNSIVRLHTVNSLGGTATWPGIGQAAISIGGVVPPNSIRYYQVLYRDVASYCTSSTFNLSQGLIVLWGP